MTRAIKFAITITVHTGDNLIYGPDGMDAIKYFTHGTDGIEINYSLLASCRGNPLGALNPLEQGIGANAATASTTTL